MIVVGTRVVIGEKTSGVVVGYGMILRKVESAECHYIVELDTQYQGYIGDKQQSYISCIVSHSDNVRKEK